MLLKRKGTSSRAVKLVSSYAHSDLKRQHAKGQPTAAVVHMHAGSAVENVAAAAAGLAQQLQARLVQCGHT